MDTILASIRRILNEDEVSPAEAAPVRREEPPEKDDVLVLGKSMMVSPPQVPDAKQPGAKLPDAKPVDAGQPEALTSAPNLSVAPISPVPAREPVPANTD